MDHPESSKPGDNPPEAQDSHAFSYLSKNQSRDRESVFSSCWFKRLVHPSCFIGENSTPVYKRSATPLADNGVISGLSVSQSVANDSSQDQPCNRPSRSSTMEDCDSSSGSPDLSINKNSQDPESCLVSARSVGSQPVNSKEGFSTHSRNSTIEISDDEHQESQPTRLLNLSIGSHTSPFLKPMNGLVQSVHLNCHMNPIGQNMHPSEDANKFNYLTQITSSLNRKKAPERDGSKRCNCTKTKCLKLYCECLSSGQYCYESCACQDCFNRHEYKDIVYETRQKIESINPLAFTPKVVPHAYELMNEGKDNWSPQQNTGRHKAGCNCKKSSCFKNYCQCHQANVGCTLECRCIGCQNSFGRKGDNKPFS